MKRLLSFLIALSAIICILSSCSSAGNNGDGSPEATVTGATALPTVSPTPATEEERLGIFDSTPYTKEEAEAAAAEGIDDPEFLKTVRGMLLELSRLMSLMRVDAFSIGLDYKTSFTGDNGIIYYKVTNPRYQTVAAFKAYLRQTLTATFADRLFETGPFTGRDGVLYATDTAKGSAFDYVNDIYLVLKIKTENHAAVQLYASWLYDVANPDEEYCQHYILLEKENGVWRVSDTNMDA